MKSDGTEQSNLTNHPGYDDWAAWSPDGTKILFMSSRSGDLEVYVMCADGSDVTNLTNDPASDQFPSWSPDGTKVYSAVTEAATMRSTS